MFVNPIMLVGVAASVLPLVIHLLSRSRYREVEWGAMMFLAAGRNAQARSRRLMDWLLLCTRCAGIALLAVALARPQLPARFSSQSVSRSGTACILLDCSASMAYDENGRPRMDLARDAAKQLVSLHRGDRVALVLMGQEQSRAERSPTTDLWDVGRRIETVEPGLGEADVDRGLSEAIESLESAPPPTADGDLPWVTFYIVTDRQALTWRTVLDGGSEWSQRWTNRLKEAGIHGRMVSIPVGSSGSANVVLEAVSPTVGYTVVGQPLDLDITVRNYGPVQWAALPLTIVADKRVVYEERIDLAPNSVGRFHAAVPGGLNEAGTHLLTAELNRATKGGVRRSTALPDDDKLTYVLDVHEPIRVLLVSTADRSTEATSRPSSDRADRPENRAASRLSAADYIQAALSPFHSAGRKRSDLCLVERADFSAWSGETVHLRDGPSAQSHEAKLSSFGVVVLAGVRQLGEGQAASIERFVRDGGGVLVAPGDGTDPVAWNNAAFHDGGGFAPLALGGLTAPDWSAQTEIAWFDKVHPALAMLAGRAQPFSGVVVGRRFRAGELAASAKSLATYADGEPFFLELPERRGRVLMLTTSLDDEFSTLPLTYSYVPLLQGAVRYLADSRPRNLNIRTSDPIELAFDDVGDPPLLRVKPPDQTDERPAELSRTAGQLVARFNDTAVPGIYQVRGAEGLGNGGMSGTGQEASPILVAATQSRAESDLTDLSDGDWNALATTAGVGKLDPNRTPITAANALPAPIDLWPYALGAVFAMGAVELLLARRRPDDDAAVGGAI